MISVIVPVYNVEAYLDRCVESLVGQTYKDLEIILVDDGSPDNCPEMCDAWARKDSRIQVIHKINGGLSAARNAGIEAASGEYIGFIDSDDWIARDMYQDLIDAIEKDNADLAVTGISRTYDNGYSVEQYVHENAFSITGSKIVLEYLKQSTFSTSANDKLYRRELFSERRFPVGKLYEDAPVIFDILCGINKVTVVGKPQYSYFQRADSICGQKFSLRKMDHYAFSKDIWEKTIKLYPQFIDAADAFWGCKLCELLYSLCESSNRYAFKNEEVQLKNELRLVWKKVIGNSWVPGIMKVKTLLAVSNAAGMYIKLKSLRVRRTAK